MATVDSHCRDRAEEVVRVLRWGSALGEQGVAMRSPPSLPLQASPPQRNAPAWLQLQGGEALCRAPWHEGMIGHAPPDHEYLSQAVRGTQGVYGWRRSTRLVKPGRWCSIRRGGSFQFALPLTLVNSEPPPPRQRPASPSHPARSARVLLGGNTPFLPGKGGAGGSGLRLGVDWVALLGPSSLSITACVNYQGSC